MPAVGNRQVFPVLRVGLGGRDRLLEPISLFPANRLG